MKIKPIKNPAFALAALLILLGGVFAAPVFASLTEGVIPSPHRYAWGENIGWINFGAAEGNVRVTDSALSGYAWGENIGWVSLNCSNTDSCAAVNYKVANNGEGALSGFAWAENAGWIDFKPANGGVTIDSSGEFAGYAWGENIGWIVFNCSTTNSCGAVDYKVATDWRPVSSRGNGGGGGIPPQPPAEPQHPEPQHPEPPTPPAEPPVFPEGPPVPPAEHPVTPITPPSPPGRPSANVPPAESSGPAVPDGEVPGGTLDNNNPGSAGEGQPQDFCALYPQNPQCAGRHPEQEAKPSGGAGISVKKIRQELAEVASAPAAPVISGTIALVGAPAAVAVQAVAAQTSIFGLSLGSRSELWLVFARIIQNLLAALGFRRKRRFWGTVYDSETKQPLDPVIVKLHDANTGETIEQAITDIFGRYGFLAQKGIFRLTARKTHYSFPAKKVSGAADEIFDHLYYGEDINLGQAEVVAPNIPMDPQGFDWNQMDKQRLVKFHPYRERAAQLLFGMLFYAGFFWVVLTAYLTPSKFNFLCLAVYALALIVRMPLPKERLWGRVYDVKTGVLLSRVVLELTPPNMPAIVLGKAKSGLEGKFFLKARPGAYRLNAYSQPAPGAKAPLGQVSVTIGKNGILNADIGLDAGRAEGKALS